MPHYAEILPRIILTCAFHLVTKQPKMKIRGGWKGRHTTTTKGAPHLFLLTRREKILKRGTVEGRLLVKVSYANVQHDQLLTLCGRKKKKKNQTKQYYNLLYQGFTFICQHFFHKKRTYTEKKGRFEFPSGATLICVPPTYFEFFSPRLSLVGQKEVTQRLLSKIFGHFCLLFGYIPSSLHCLPMINKQKKNYFSIIPSLKNCPTRKETWRQVFKFRCQL